MIQQHVINIAQSAQDVVVRTERGRSSARVELAQGPSEQGGLALYIYIETPETCF